MPDLSRRIHRITEELRLLQEELRHASLPDPTRREPAQMLQDLRSLESVNHLRSSVDHMRTFLWAYVEAATQRFGGSVDSALQTARVRRTTEMLRVLREQFSAPESVPMPEARSLFAEISAMAHTAYERHSAGPQCGSPNQDS